MDHAEGHSELGLRGRTAGVSVTAVLLRSLLAAVLGASATLAVADGKLRIALLHKGSFLDFWDDMHAGARATAAELGVELLFDGPPYSDNAPAQIKLVNRAVESGIDALLLVPTDRAALEEPVKKAVARGVKVVIVDSELNGSSYSAFVGTDNVAAGRVAAQKLASLLEGQGKLAMIRLIQGSGSTEARARGFRSEIERHPKLRLVEDALGGALEGAAFRVTKEVLGRHPDLAGIFCVNESTTKGALLALRDARRKGVRFVGFDSNPELLEGVRSKEIDALLVQDPAAMGAHAVRLAVDAISGKPSPRQLHTGIKLMTQENLTRPEAKAAPAPGTIEASKRHD